MADDAPAAAPAPAAEASEDAIKPAPAPWHCKCTSYMISFWTSGATAASLPAKAFSPLERASAFASPEQSGRAVGGLSMVQLVRYTDTPVGPYDELILAPGAFEYSASDDAAMPGNKNKKRKKTAKAMRITRIYVSQKETCWNGRTLWNLPKHLARFEWSTTSSGATHVAVYPHDTSTPYNSREAAPSNEPFFQCSIKTIPFIPSFPLSTRVLDKLPGVSTVLVQPPLPGNADAAHGELPGTKLWCRLGDYAQYSRTTSLAWADVRQPAREAKDSAGEEGEEEEEEEEEYFENFFPGLRRWNLALKMADGELFFPAGDTWEAPKDLS
ncbi:hypothetical protein B0T26DRAFT_635209 [Lasiosphaeria miniovina]|uniref:Uncharacterized protein n=1 Tax=Lasiosphaeria miniovina TaxID=1954250 RepID=A0AA40EDQ1_9PEZI|nr:uncharacterized protein B0T26DRAFT_635209 [Lasiosphaeria miniovina]KAK0734587.1 hypothetical protein B0T26DRAFT_635209 [Lasiosphaeria miniovina]